VRVFLDSSALAKRYVEEPGSREVDALCAHATELALAVVCVPEISSALNRRVREGVLTQPHYVAAKRRLSANVRDAIIIDPVPSDITSAIAILESNTVRAMDALHVACALEWHCDLFASSDKRQVLAAKRAGLKARHM